jgi:tetraacyldisaccharide 4'-kinase
MAAIIMSGRSDLYFLNVIRGRRSGPAATLVRAGLRAGEVPYSIATSLRNAMYQAGTLRTHRVGRPVVCVGNITTGGTGKTPVVRWLAQRLLADQIAPAIVLRGYKSLGAGVADEQLLHRKLLPPSIPVHANPDRVAGARQILREHPGTRVILLDDGFQHRRLRRDFDLVLIDATDPFGGDHLLPRGLLREHPAGLSRASAILITHAESVDDAAVASITARIRVHAPAAPTYRCRHELLAQQIRGSKVFAFCGIGNPEVFERQVAREAQIVGSERFVDHHRYSPADVERLRRRARGSAAEMLVTTEKDWVKIEPLLPAGPDRDAIIPLRLEIRFDGDDEARLYEQIKGVLIPH